jgi:hypothetical protein
MSTRKFKILFLTLCLLVTAGAAGVYLFTGDAFPGEERVSAKVKEIEGYRTWKKVNSVPQLMPDRVAMSCAILRSPETGKPLQSGPHAGVHFNVYVNSTGQKAMLGEKSPAFPAGSVIVKEKLASKESTNPQLLTVMIKHEKGYNERSGDWEYMVTDGTGAKVEGRGMMENCQACHVGQKKTDYLFRSYLEEDTKKNLK